MVILFVNCKILINTFQKLLLFKMFQLTQGYILGTSLVNQTVKRLPTMRETQVQSLCWEDLEKEMGIHPSILAWKIPWKEKLGRLQYWGHKESDTLSDFTFTFKFIYPVNSEVNIKIQHHECIVCSPNRCAKSPIFLYLPSCH